MKEIQSRLDFERRQRIGMVEAIWGEHKTIEQLVEIVRRLQSEGELALITRVDKKKAEGLKKTVHNAVFHEHAQCNGRSST